MNLLIRVFGCEMAVNSTRVDRPQRMTSPLVEDRFSGRQSHLSRMNAVEYHRSGHRGLLNSQEPCCGRHHAASAYIACIGYGCEPAASEHANLHNTAVGLRLHNPEHAVDGMMLTECILRTNCYSNLAVTILVHELACEVYPHSQTDIGLSGVCTACGRRMSTLFGIKIHRHLLIDKNS